MYDKIKANLSNPDMLEKLYREDRKAFEEAFEKLYPGIENTESAKFWKARIEFGRKPDQAKTLNLQDISIVIVICLIVSLLIKIPALFNIGLSETVFYQKNAATVVFLGLTLYTIWFSRISGYKELILTALAFLVPVVYINLLHPVGQGASVNLVYIHLPFLLWCIFGIVYAGYDLKNREKRIDFIRYNGDLAIIYALIAIAGVILTAITITLFNSIGLKIERFYSEYIVITGAVAAPVVAAFVIRNYPALVNKTAPMIASIFSPLVLLTLMVFLTTMLVTGKDPYNDRTFLLIFNVMLFGVMSIIVFSVSETSVTKNQKFNIFILLVLSIITIVIDLIALSAIFYRLREFGLTPNRIAVLVSNILVLVNLFLIMSDLIKVFFKKKESGLVAVSLAKFLPVYLVWVIIVIFGFPLIFGMK